jgi:hypothetical protein
MPDPKVVFQASLARTTEDNVLSEQLGEFPTLLAAESAIKVYGRGWQTGTIYEVEITYDRDELGPIPVEHERSTRYYVEAADGSFVLDDLIEVAP